MRQRLETEVKVGIFVAIGLALTMLSILLLGGTSNWFSKTFQYSSHFSSVEGLIPGAKVIVSGVNVGTVDSVEFDSEKRDIRVRFSVNKEALQWIRQGSLVEIATQGVLGDKFISISAGSGEEPQLPPGSELSTRTSKDFTQFLKGGDQLLVVLNRIAGNLDKIFAGFQTDNRSERFFKNMTDTSKSLTEATEKLNEQLSSIQLKASVDELHQILEKVNRGNGTIGSLVNDPSLYDEIRALVGGANRNRLMRNLIRKTIRDTEKGEDAQTEHPPSDSK